MIKKCLIIAFLCPYISIGMQHKEAINPQVIKELVVPIVIDSIKQNGYSLEQKSFYGQHKMIINCTLLAGGIVGSLALIKYLLNYTTNNDISNGTDAIKQLLNEKSIKNTERFKCHKKKIKALQNYIYNSNSEGSAFTLALKNTQLSTTSLQKQHDSFFYTYYCNNNKIIASLDKIKEKYSDNLPKPELLLMQKSQTQLQNEVQQLDVIVQNNDREFTEQLDQLGNLLNNLSDASQTMKNSISSLNENMINLQEKETRNEMALSQLENILIAMKQDAQVANNNLKTMHSINQNSKSKKLD